ncbi:TPA: HK97 family phage prohead protease [Vibrio parahaemolyticus]|nr:HK97 family phage prohead protease [Vibrio parahaemolyticus]HCG7105661.1 HK97 family phage prohead protease [Vibrio parahaemolyticus]
MPTHNNKNKVVELRSSDKFEARPTGIFELRSVDAEEGIIEGYATTFGTVDSYNTTFRKGCFAKSLRERKGKVKILENHDAQAFPIGVPLEMKEDETGLFVRIQFAMSTTRGKEAFELAKIGAINTLSFGFAAVKSTVRSDGVIEYTEVVLFEISPVNFEANPTATINNVRSIEQRSTQFSESLNDIEMSEKGYMLKQALNHTMSDIWWNEELSFEEKIEAMNTAIDDYRVEYINWMKDINGAGEVRGMPNANALANAFNEALDGRSVADFTLETNFTLDQVQSLRKGELLAEGADLSLLPEAVRQAYTGLQDEAAQALHEQIEALSEEKRSELFAQFENNNNKEIEHKDELTIEQRQAIADITAQLDSLRNNYKTK